MRTVRTTVFMMIAMFAATAMAAPKKAGKSDFSDMFAGMDKAPARSAKHAAHAPAKHAAKVARASSKAAPAAAAPTLVAQAAPRDQLVLSDYAPDRHALVGP